jgi:hypothetical protein
METIRESNRIGAGAEGRKRDILKIGIIVGSTRPGRKAIAVAKWVHDILKSRKDAEFEIAARNQGVSFRSPRCGFETSNSGFHPVADQGPEHLQGSIQIQISVERSEETPELVSHRDPVM